MLKCPYCQFDNEDGALFCEQCKSDLGGVAAEAVPVAAAVAVEAAPMEAMAVEAAPVMAEAAPVMAEAAPAAAPAAAGAPLPAGSAPKLVVIRGQKINAEYPVYEGLNFIGRADEKPVDRSLTQEPTRL